MALKCSKVFLSDDFYHRVGKKISGSQKGNPKVIRIYKASNSFSLIIVSRQLESTKQVN